MTYCCEVMEEYANEKNNLVDYEPSHRSYSFYLVGDPYGSHQRMHYCFWCGSKLPTNLAEIWGEILDKEFGVEDVIFDREKIPPEFKTDEWWKKRGL